MSVICSIATAFQQQFPYELTQWSKYALRHFVFCQRNLRWTQTSTREKGAS